MLHIKQKPQEKSWLVANEFAQVRVHLDREGHSARVRIEDVQTGQSICLDAFSLASLVWMSDDILTSHADPNLPYQAMMDAATLVSSDGRGNG